MDHRLLPLHVSEWDRSLTRNINVKPMIVKMFTFPLINYLVMMIIIMDLWS